MKFLLVLVLFGVATYLLVRALQRRGVMPEGTARPTRRNSAPPRIVAPDDDEDFLRDLERERRRRDRQDPETPA